MKMIKKLSLVFLVILASGLMCFCTALSALGVDVQFEKEIASFPESYKTYLRTLHEQYPLWKFEAFETGLDWETVIDNEHDDYALVYASTAARVFKSLDPDDYNPATDTFYYKDGGFVAGSRTAVEYFMDPRNFLDKGGIFQFEKLNFSSKITVEMVDAALGGSFMYNKKMTYVDKTGKTYTDNLTYAEAIYKAGQTYDINPCFIASKILNEVGSKGSDSVSGTNNSYPGIYNFYNIGASDGAGAIERGLLWASGSGEGRTTYSRPWTTPYRSIMGGAEFLAEDYISAGQFTGYLQRFNVNPDADYHLYGHQYMSNLTGALSQGYSTYYSYAETDSLNTNLIFSIPVFKNMSDESGTGKLVGAENVLQYGVIDLLYTGVRKGPSVDHPRVTDSSGNTVWLEEGDEVRIIGKGDTDAYYHSEILSEPYWYKISFVKSGVSYVGYIPGDYINIKTAVYVTPGVTDISFVKTSNVKHKIHYSDPRMVKVIDDNTVQFLKNGVVSLYLYDSSGHFEEIVFRVGDYSSFYTKNLNVVSSENAIRATVDKHDTAAYYCFALADSNGNLIYAPLSTEPTTLFQNIKSGTVYTLFAQNCFGKYAFTKTVSRTVVTRPQQVKNLIFNKTTSGTAVLSWSPVENATGYQVLTFDESTGKYVNVALIPFGTNRCVLTSAQLASENFTVRAYCKYSGGYSFGLISNSVNLSDKPPMPDNVKITGTTTSGYVLSWNGHKDCSGYQVYVCAEGQSNYTLYKETTATALAISGLPGADVRSYKIRSYKNVGNERLYSSLTAVITGITYPEKPAVFNVRVGSGRAIAAWSAVKGATSYNFIYRKVGQPVKAVSVNGTSTEVKGLEGFSDYLFAVVPVIKRGTVSLAGTASNLVSARTLPNVPSGITLTAVGKNFVDIQWNADKSLEAYRVYVIDQSGKIVLSQALTVNKYRAAGLLPDSQYSIILRGYNRLNGAFVSSENSPILPVRTIESKITGIKIGSTDNSALVVWDAVANAECYEVYLYENGVFNLKQTVDKNSVTLEGLRHCTTNYVAIKACFKADEKTYPGELAIQKFYTRPLNVEKIVQSNRTDTSYTLTWQASSSPVNRYYVYRYNDAAQKYDCIAITDKTSCVITGMKPGTLQRYAVLAAVVVDGKVLVASRLTYTFTCGTYLSKVENIRQTVATQNALRFVWDPVEGATEYRVYYFDPAKKAYRLLGSTTATVATYRNLAPSTQYVFLVNAVKVTEEATFIGYYSSVLYASTK